MTSMRVALVAFTTTGAAGDYVSALGTAMADRAEVSMWIPSRPHLEVPGPEIHLLDKASSRAGVAAHEVLASIGPSNLAKSISAWAPDVVHIAFGEGYPSAARVARALRGRCSVVATWHDPRPHGEPLDRVQHMVAALTMGAARGIHVHCAEVQPDDMSSQILIAEHPAFPCGSCGRSATTQPPRASGPIVFVGRFAPYKGIDQLCAALTDYWRAGGDRPLVVVGQGRAPKALRDLEERWRSLTTVVNEYVSSRDLHDVLSNASVCAMPYLSGTQSALP
ncbi:MAG TPA: glycosyltransferase, partial [Acidimicrobiales bacterium]|nr:glycosyltransferase [Acidimicrobiales bacterium]